MVTLILIIFCFWLFWKLLRLWVVHKIKKHARNTFEQFTGAKTGSQTDDAHRTDRRKSGWQHAHPSKKIGRDEGEYVEWEEITISTETNASDNAGNATRSSTVIDRQIVDAEWEDIK